MYPKYEYTIPDDQTYAQFNKEFRQGLCDYIMKLPDTELKEIMRGSGMWPEVAIVPTHELNSLIDIETRFLTVLKAIRNIEND